MKISGMRKMNKGAIRAYFDVEQGGFLMKDFKLMESDSGYWVSFPKRSYEHKGETKWAPVVSPSDPGDTKLIELLSALARDAYQGAK